MFAQEEGDMGCVPNLQLNLSVVDNNPVQKC